jgi:hypothetical protein
MEINFGAWTPYTIGGEEESQLVDPWSHALVPVIDAVLAARDVAGFSASSATSELSAPCLEARSSVFATATELAKELPPSRRRVGDFVEKCGSGRRIEPARCSSFLPPFAGKRRGRLKESVASHGVSRAFDFLDNTSSSARGALRQQALSSCWLPHTRRPWWSREVNLAPADLARADQRSDRGIRNIEKVPDLFGHLFLADPGEPKRQRDDHAFASFPN